jgi:AraC family transcriptional regulator
MGKRRFLVCFAAQNPVVPNEKFGTKNLDSGTYAVFSLQGSYEKLSDLYKAIYFHWLPNSD